MDNIQDGTILHCFNWTYNDIKAELPNIAKAGFSSIQTSPAQTGTSTGIWYWLYQPLGFYIGSNDLGTKEELKALCDAADEYGIKIIVDVVANHLDTNHNNIQEDLKPSQYWHSNDSTGLGSRAQKTQLPIGAMPDINSEDAYVQSCVKQYVQELKSVGVDGIRWDAAKHIALPSEGCTFWSEVIDPDMYNYGEILGDPGSSSDDRNKTLMSEYTDYMNITDDHYGKILRDAFNSGYTASSIGNWSTRGIANDQLVYWGESHDTWSNNQDYGYSNQMSQNVIDRAYAIAASRNGSTALYFSRPGSTVKETIFAGEKGSTHFTSAEVAAVNHFHNAMSGQPDYYTTGNNCSVVCRTQGAVIAAASGSNISVSVPNGGSTVEPGTYTDEITGNQWTVTESTISGTIGSSGIAVIYEDAVFNGSVGASPNTNTSFEGTADITLKAINVTDAHYTTSEGQSGSYKNNDKITIGTSTAIGSYVTVDVSGTKSDGSAINATYRYRKRDPNEALKIYFDNTSYQWQQVYAYIYDSAGNIAENAAWPGKLMSYNSELGLYEIDASTYKGTGKIIFTETSDVSGNRYPAAGNSGLYIGSASMLFGENHSWKECFVDELLNKGSVSISQKNNSTFTADTLTLTLNASNVVSAEYQTSENVSGSYTNGDNITIGASTSFGDSVTVTLTGTQNNGEKVTATYTYYKKAPASVTMVYFDNTSYQWNTVYAYVYNSGTDQMAAWPGTEMTELTDDLYVLEIPEQYTSTGKIIFTESKNADTNRYPANNVEGMLIGGKSMIFGENHSWQEYTPPAVTGSVSASKKSGTAFTDTLDVVLYAKDVTDTVYTTSEDSGEHSYQDGDSITIGSSVSAGESVTLTVRGKKSDGTTIESTYQYEKSIKIYFDNSTYQWNNVYAHIYNSNGSMAAWPGKQMTLNPKTNLYELDVTGDFVKNSQVIFSAGSGSDNDHRYPRKDANGNSEGLVIDGTSKKLNGDVWQNYPTDICEEDISLSEDSFVYDASVKTVNVTVTIGNVTLTENEDYTVSGNSAVKAGSYTLTVTGINHYTGTVSKNWNITENTYTVNVENGTLADGSTSGEFKMLNRVKVVADQAPNGQKFSHWLKNGVKVSSKETYLFMMPKQNTVLKAVYEQDPDSLAKTSIKSVTAKANKKLSFVSISSVPENCTIVYAGLLATKNADKANDLTEYTADYIKYRSFSNRSSSYTWTVTASTNDIWYVRSYLVYRNAQGEEHTIYGDLVKADRNGRID